MILQRDLLEEQAAIFWDKLFLDKCMSMCDVNYTKLEVLHKMLQNIQKMALKSKLLSHDGGT